MTKLQAIRKFADYVACEHVIIPKERTEWSMIMSDAHPRMTVPADLTLIDENDRIFRNDFIQRCPLARGFAHVTLSILHEIGHHFNREVYIFSDIVEDENETTEEHIKLPYEIVATNWAIEWLQDKENRKVAKAFERDFFRAVR